LDGFARAVMLSSFTGTGSLTSEVVTFEARITSCYLLEAPNGSPKSGSVEDEWCCVIGFVVIGDITQLTAVPKMLIGILLSNREVNSVKFLKT
jgi:hypothetical protein